MDYNRTEILLWSFFCPKRQNGKNVVADVLSAEKTGGSLSKELGALPE